MTGKFRAFILEELSNDPKIHRLIERFSLFFGKNRGQGCYNLGAAQTNLGDFDSALSSYRKSCLLKHPAGCRMVGTILLVKKDSPVKAIPSLEKACELKDKYGCYNLACAYARIKKNSEAVSALNLAVQNGFDEVEVIKSDKDLAVIRTEQGYQRIVSTLEGRAR